MGGQNRQSMFGFQNFRLPQNYSAASTGELMPGFDYKPTFKSEAAPNVAQSCVYYKLFAVF